MTHKITFIGMGEAGSAIVGGWNEGRRAGLRAHDIKSDDPATAATMAERYRQLGIEGCPGSAEAVSDAELVFSTVTADQAVVAAESAAPYLSSGAFWFDLNSCAPSSKRRAAQAIEAAGGRYVDVAVMAPVHPKRNMVPLLISGPHAGAAEPILADLPMAPRVVAGEVGAASSIKMIRSVMVKGMEALTAECTLAAVAAGVEDEVFDSLARSHPGMNWRDAAAYNFERAMLHGARRAAEMEEVAKTLADLGLPNDMASSTVHWERRIAAAGLPAPEDAISAGPKALADILLPILRRFE
jgi:3-hydroxyisobutyrate dehydrogenase-like beta-hydroxyacid dehydrogenase